jgi:hypothetical protein
MIRVRPVLCCSVCTTKSTRRMADRPMTIHRSGSTRSGALIALRSASAVTASSNETRCGSCLGVRPLEVSDHHRSHTAQSAAAGVTSSPRSNSNSSELEGGRATSQDGGAGVGLKWGCRIVRDRTPWGACAGRFLCRNPQARTDAPGPPRRPAHGIPEVGGSIPLGSISSLFLNDRVRWWGRAVTAREYGGVDGA